MKTRFFTECSDWWRKGYFIPVMNQLNNKTERRFITVAEKEVYLRKFGEKIITKQEFIDWWCKEFGE